ncbi:CPBP family intramembrane metalloprotease [Corynebacterium sp. TAE3-ERU12]|uniref:CPBP family intramembrane glutamic endopeptidase n=1 Tax=Corynebacterium sp. TAE3-ERU12 TaxID=2849491 RepID=UPI001C493889|nr:CPBP family intramembrane glutamic endopeptidase [Corynebacterium sp. TAE3-ERU12]MBV7295843.1 CPBP family intramembrane metalloprotease [Corynebacterium sp. TAE3-ERU12]
MCTRREKMALGVMAGYIALMAIGLGVWRFAFGIYYADANFGKTYVIVEAAMCTFAWFGWRWIERTHFSGDEKPIPPTFGKIRRAWVFAPFALTLGYAVLVLLIDGHVPDSVWPVVSLLILVAFVGFSEELIFRGVVLRNFMAERSVFVAIVVSATGFSLLHSVNVIGGLPLQDVLMQMASTFSAGLLFAGLYLCLNSLWPLMIYHALFDFSLLASGLFGVDMQYHLVPLTLLEYLLVIPIVWWVATRYKVPQDEMMLNT